MTDETAQRMLDEFFNTDDLATTEVTKLLEGLDKLKLTVRQKLFCLYFNTMECDTFRHQTNSYKKAFDSSSTSGNPSAKASVLMKKVKIKSGIRLAEKFLNPTFYDKKILEQEHWDLYIKAKEEDRHKDAIKMIELMGKSVDFYGKDSKDNKDTQDIDTVKKAADTNINMSDKISLLRKKAQ